MVSLVLLYLSIMKIKGWQKSLGRPSPQAQTPTRMGWV